MSASELRQKFLAFFKAREHTVVPSSSLLPDDPSVLLTTAGMQQFKPYFMGKADPQRDFGSLNTASIQKSFRTSDIDEVGDESHLTFFEMMGNFSFGGYFKKEAIEYAKEFIESIGLTIQYVTVFEGDDKTPKDTESEKIWNSLGFSQSNGNLKFEGREDNFWGPTGNEGPCGPTTEIYINDTEIWNIVFNEYYCKSDGSLEPLATPGVDTGMGLERLTMVSQGKSNIFETDLFSSISDLVPDNMDIRTKRIVADHARGIVFLISDGIRPSNKEAGYLLRRLMRRIIVWEDVKSQGSSKSPDRKAAGHGLSLPPIIEKVIDLYQIAYPRLGEQKQMILDEFEKERVKFAATLTKGLNELGRMQSVDGVSAFMLYQSFGLPYESIKEIAGEKAEKLTREDFDIEFEKHREASRAGLEKKFGGHGLLLDTGELKAADEEELKIVTRLHTATHLLQAALRKVLGDTVTQAGSDITAERLRFDFTFDRKLTAEELAQTEEMINDVIQRNLDMGYQELPYEEAIKTGALYFEREKYPAEVKVYSAVDPKSGEVFSSELCGGPHVSHTAELAHFKITKEESAGAGIRRIRAVVDFVVNAT